MGPGLKRKVVKSKFGRAQAMDCFMVQMRNRRIKHAACSAMLG